MTHLCHDDFEGYSMATLPDSESGLLEDHLLICLECRNQLQLEIDFVTAMRLAAAIRRGDDRL